MGSNLLLLIFICIIVYTVGNVISSQSTKYSSSLKESHLILIPAQLAQMMETKMNSSGHVVSSIGSIPEIVDWLALRFEFRYTYLPSVASLVIDDMAGKRGKISYLRNKEADVIVGAILPTVSRFKEADFPLPWSFSPFAIVIPFPRSSTNIQAVFQPWKTEIWIGLFTTLPAVIMCLYGLSRFFKHTGWINQRSASLGLFQVTNYVICVLLSQGGHFTAKKVALRCAAAVWCLSCLILVQSYSCILISVITLPKIRPMINSVYDMHKINGLQMVVNRGMAVNVALEDADYGIFKQLKQSIKNNPDLLCNETRYCLDRVLSGHFVYANGLPFTASAIRKDLKEFGFCRFTQAREFFWTNLFSIALAKNSPYMESFNRGFAELFSSGLIQRWTNTYSPSLSECLIKSGPNIAKSSLSLNNLAGAFTVLMIGYAFSCVALVGEILMRCLPSRSRGPSSTVDSKDVP